MANGNGHPTFKTDGDGNVIKYDITPYLFEKADYDNLSSYEGAYPYVKAYTYSNRLEEVGVPPKVKQYLLGHAKLDTTQNVYTDTQAHYVNRFLDDIRGAFDTRLTPKMTP